MVNKPTILLTNDDGVYAKGLNELIRSLKGFANLIVVAPDGPRSGMSSSITSAVPIKYKLLRKEEGLVVYSCTGTPVDCVKLAMNEILQCKPDLLLSGINHGTNVAICVHYSGTIGAAIEGCVFKVPSVGISLTSHSPDADFSESCRISRMVIEKILKFGLPDGTYLNLNVPYTRDVKGVRVCSQASGKWVNEFMCSSNASGEPVFWLTGNFEEEKPDHPENDTLALEQGFASLVPCRIDVTNYDFMERLKEQWF